MDEKNPELYVDSLFKGIFQKKCIKKKFDKN